MSELKSFIDETFNNLKSKIEEEYNFVFGAIAELI
jgi:hypothetical protein